ncbi:MAG: glycosyltransferase family 4 protein [Myxococcota bacterium]
MRLALLVRTLGTMGGTERFVYGLARSLLAMGHRVDVWCQRVDQELRGVAVHALGAGGRGRIWKMWSAHRAALRIPADDYDLVLGFIRAGRPGLYRAGGGCHAAYRRRLGRTGLADQIEERMDRAVISSARRIIVNSRMVAREMDRWYGLPEARTRLIYNGVDLERFSPSVQGGRGRFAVFLGNGFARKGLATAIRAVARIEGLSLQVIGRTERLNTYQRLAEEVGLSDRLRFMGALEEPEMMLRRAAVMVLPTRYDPFANACLEALACGTPVVTSRANGAAEVLPDAWMTVTDPEDVDGFAAAMERALHDRGVSDRCRAAAERYPAHHAHHALAAAIEELTP